jgi:hypothetical protein
MIPGSANPLLLASAAQAGGYAIERSLRFNSSDSAYLSRTPASAGNRKTWTWAGWVKLSGATRNWLFSASETVNNAIEVYNDGRLYVYHGSGSPGYVGWSGVLRDYSAWYHLVVTIDTTQAASANRVKAYINGNQITFDEGAQPAQNSEPTNGINSTSLHNICRHFSGSSYTVNCYLADIHFIDGQALDPTSFGEFDDNGIWQPIAYTGTYGTNGFHLDFADNSTAAALGTDTSGNSNTWTVNNISVAAGAGNDSLVDVPTNGSETDTGVGGEVRGNYCTWNPLATDFQLILNNGNLDTTTTGAGDSYHAYGTIGLKIGKWYCEFTVGAIADSGSAGYPMYGLVTSSTTVLRGGAYLPGGSSSGGVGIDNDGDKRINGTQSAYGSAYTAGDIISMAYDADNGAVYFAKNGIWMNSATASEIESGTTTNAAYTYAGGTIEHVIAVAEFNNSASSLNTGARPFAYTAPSGFKALNTANLPAPTIEDGSTAMDVVLDTGANILTAAQGAISGSADLLWIKDRANSNNHQLIDTVRGGTATLQSNTTAAETTYSAPSGSSVAWTWDADSSTVTNTQGSISSQVRANASAGFSIVTYTGTGANATVGHGLGIAPALIIPKRRDSSDSWYVYHSSANASPATGILILNGTNAFTTASNVWNNTAPTSTVFSVGTSTNVNASSGTYVAYCFAPVEGYSAFGTMIGNGLDDGPFCYCGFRPSVVIMKNITNSSDWQIHDAVRDPYNAVTKRLRPNLNNNETDPSGIKDFLSNGFKMRTSGAGANASGDTYIWAAWAESPFQYARAR